MYVLFLVVLCVCLLWRMHRLSQTSYDCEAQVKKRSRKKIKKRTKFIMCAQPCHFSTTWREARLVKVISGEQLLRAAD